MSLLAEKAILTTSWCAVYAFAIKQGGHQQFEIGVVYKVDQKWVFVTLQYIQNIYQELQKVTQTESQMAKKSDIQMTKLNLKYWCNPGDTFSVLPAVKYRVLQN